MSATIAIQPSANGQSKSKGKTGTDRKPAQQCATCEHVGSDVVEHEGTLICAACADALLEETTETTATPEPSAPTPEPQPEPAKPAGAVQDSKAQQALWDQAIGIDNAVAFGVTTSAVRIGELILQSFDVVRPGLAHGRETRDAYSKLLITFGQYYTNATKRSPQTARWVNAYVAYALASEDSRALILGSETAPFSCDTLVALAADAHDPDPTRRDRPGLVTIDPDTITWKLDDNTDDGATRYNALIRDIVDKGYTAEQVRKEVKRLKRTARATHETQQQREQREQAEKAERIAERRKRKDKAVATLVKAAEELQIGKPEMTATLLGAGIIADPKPAGAYNPATMTAPAAREFAAELILAGNDEAIGALIAALVSHVNGVNAHKQPGKKATATLNASPGPKPADNPVQTDAA